LGRTVAWGWQFNDDDAWLTASFDKGKFFTDGELRYNVEKATYQLTLTTNDKKKQTFSGNFEGEDLTLDRTGGRRARTSASCSACCTTTATCIVLKTRTAGSPLGFTKNLAGGGDEGRSALSRRCQRGRNASVSGGLGTMKVSYKRQGVLRLLHRLPRCLRKSLDPLSDSP